MAEDKVLLDLISGTKKVVFSILAHVSEIQNILLAYRDFLEKIETILYQQVEVST